ncbi:MAG: YkgJ family cysteine cluster protein [Magnetospirillum sp. WYHS-4]
MSLSPALDSDAAIDRIGRSVNRLSVAECAGYESARAEAEGGLREGLDGLLAATGRIVAQAGQLWEGMRSGAPEATGKAACRAGCGWCCHQRVGALLPEVFWIARRIGDEGRRDEALARLSGSKGGKACPFLEEGGCTIYALRPLKCRGLYVRDAAWCMRTYAGIVAPTAAPPLAGVLLPEPKDLFDGALKGLALTLIRKGRDCPGVEFAPTLRLVLDGRLTAEAWWRGRIQLPEALRLDWFPAPR